MPTLRHTDRISASLLMSMYSLRAISYWNRASAPFRMALKTPSCVRSSGRSSGSELVTSDMAFASARRFMRDRFLPAADR